MKKIIAFVDIETGGFNKDKHALCELAFVIVEMNSDTVLCEYSRVISPHIRLDGEPGFALYDERAMEVNKIPIHEIHQGAQIESVFEEMEKMFEDYGVTDVCAHNGKKFDFSWIGTLFEYFMGYSMWRYDEIDTLDICKEQFPELKSHSQENMCKHFEIPTFDSHRALTDCRALHYLYKQITQ